MLVQLVCVVSVVVAFYRYEEQLKEQQNQLEKEDLSDMVAEHAARQKVVPMLHCTVHGIVVCPRKYMLNLRLWSCIVIAMLLLLHVHLGGLYL